MPDPSIWTHPWLWLLTALVFGYALGSTPFGLILTRLAGFGDVRDIGSGNIGATNVLRTGSKKLAALTVLGDMAKGTLPVIIAGRWGLDLALAAGLGAFLGHLFPFWLRFRGGKGVATYVGIVLGISILASSYWPILIVAATWISMAVIFRISSLAALIAMVVTPSFVWVMGLVPQAELLALISILSIIMHHENITRLLNGTESRIGSKG